MSGFYESLRDSTATPLIKQYGQPVTLLRIRRAEDIECEYDPETGEEVCVDADTGEVVDPNERIEYQGHAVVETYAKGLIDGSAVQTGDRKLISVGLPTPSAGSDRIVVGGVEYSVVSVAPIAPGGVTVVTEVQIR